MYKMLLLIIWGICRLIIAAGFSLDPMNHFLDGQLTLDRSYVEAASMDFGMVGRVEPVAVVKPGSAEDVARVVRAAYVGGQGLRVSARGHGHSINGQAQAENGVVIEMNGGGGKGGESRVWEKEKYVDVWGGELWIDVLKKTLEYGLAPKSWTDYLYLSVGGTLSNAGISGQAFNHGPQISNVNELDVVTGIYTYVYVYMYSFLNFCCSWKNS